ncbi:hypothetical protein NG895_02180 [Aeoliella sp. ICT_H6.2]|uniref:DNA-directed RNA polymerase specialized sigma24 family protein n=1 Tax=Aeoliella straminimaris TaxID=2954799 RepID=A0A9X2JHA3_9BACT|nr:hypothetical protein [Aeoliella straminimaris]MCO6042704.1 hypothetical protein [Aeoliella straminimaris]
MVEIPDYSDDDWELLVKRLTLYADSKLRKVYWRGAAHAPGGSGPGGMGPDEFAAEAIESFLDGSRKWNKETEPEFLRFLFNVVDSKISHLVESAENSRTRRIDTCDRDSEPAFQVKSGAKRPDVVVADQEQSDLLHNAVISELDGDTTAVSVFECFEADITKPSEIAEMMGIGIDEVNNAKKRLARSADKAFRKLGRSRR